MKLNQRMLLVILAFLYIPLLLLAFLAYIFARSTMVSHLNDQLESIVLSQKDRVQYWREVNLDRAKVFASRLQLRNGLASYNLEANPENQEFINQISDEAVAFSSTFKEVFILNPAGLVVASTQRSLIGDDFSRRDFFTKALQDYDISIFFKNQDGEVNHYLVGPLTLNGRLIGAFVIVADAVELARQVTNYYGLHQTGEAYIVKREPDGITFLTPTRFDPDAALTRHEPDDSTNVSSLALRENQQVITDSIDYRGKIVVAATEYLSEIGWGIIVKMDKDEFYQPVSNMNNFMILLLLLITLSVAIIYFMLVSFINRPVLRLAKEVEGYCEEEGCPRIDMTMGNETDYLTGILRQIIMSLRLSREDMKGKVQEMEKLNKAMLNRELKMAQMKREISELKKITGK